MFRNENCHVGWSLASFQTFYLIFFRVKAERKFDIFYHVYVWWVSEKSLRIQFLMNFLLVFLLNLWEILFYRNSNLWKIIVQVVVSFILVNLILVLFTKYKNCSPQNSPKFKSLVLIIPKKINFAFDFFLILKSFQMIEMVEKKNHTISKNKVVTNPPVFCKKTKRWKLSSYQTNNCLMFHIQFKYQFLV